MSEQAVCGLLSQARRPRTCPHGEVVAAGGSCVFGPALGERTPTPETTGAADVAGVENDEKEKRDG